MQSTNFALLQITLFSVLYRSYANEPHYVMSEFKNNATGKTYFYNRVNWRNATSAIKFCASLNTSLVKLQSRADTDFVIKTVRPTSNFLIAAESTQQRIPVKWVDGKPITWYDWAQGEPHMPWSTCWVFAASYMTGKWEALACPSRHHVICERIERETRPDGRPEARQFHNPQNGKTYALTATPMNTTSGVAYCKSIGGKLIQIESQQETAWIRSNLKMAPQQYFLLGVQLVESTTGPAVWADGSRITWFNWQKKHPRTIPMYAWAVLVDHATGEWYAVNNVVEYPPVCEKRGVSALRKVLDRLQRIENNQRDMLDWLRRIESKLSNQ